jgi:hypothetical protein
MSQYFPLLTNSFVMWELITIAYLIYCLTNNLQKIDLLFWAKKRKIKEVSAYLASVQKN